jgi:hypothetical protein
MRKIVLNLIFTFTCITLNAQTTLSLGDIAFVAYNSDGTVPTGTPADQFGFVCLVGISSSTVINFTDQGWLNAGGFYSNGGDATITVTFSSALTSGDQVFIDAAGGVVDQAGTTVGSFSGSGLSFPSSGDQIFAYQGSAPTNNTSAQLAKFIAAIHMNCDGCTTGNWDGDATSSTTSAKPSVFIATGTGTNTTYFPTEIDNARHNCSSSGSIATSVYNLSNWTTSNSSGFAAFNCSFSVPVELIGFEAQKRKKDIKLIWQTASELNNLNFEVQRSEDGIHWQSVIFIKGFGTTNIIQSYSYVDTKPILGKNYYRLKQNDYDGAFEYSPVILINRSTGEIDQVKISPNPAYDIISIEGFYGDIRVYNYSGVLLKSVQITNDISEDISLFDVPDGLYLIELNSINGSKEVRKISKTTR